MQSKNSQGHQHQMEHLTLTKALNKKEDLNREQHMILILFKIWMEQGEKKSIRVNSEEIAYAAFKNWPSEYSWNLEKYRHLPDYYRFLKNHPNTQNRWWQLLKIFWL